MRSGDARPEPSRRRVLTKLSAATAGATGLTGCLGDFTGSETATSTRTATQTATETHVSTQPSGASAVEPDEYGPPSSGKWEATLSDHFDGGELDRSIWSPGIEGHGGNCADGGGRSFCWRPDHVTVDAETDRLRLRVSDGAPPPDERDPRDADVGYTVGAVNTRDAFAQEFGYFEAAARIPDEPGTLPAFWLFLDKFESDWREINVYEKNGAHDATTLKMGSFFEQDDDGPERPAVEHQDNDDRIRVEAGEGTDRIDVSDPVDETFHVFGLEWAPETLTWYVDGEVVGRVDHPGVAEFLPGRELFLVLNCAVFDGPDWIGSPADAHFPHSQEFEWVRAWQRTDWA